MVNQLDSQIINDWHLKVWSPAQSIILTTPQPLQSVKNTSASLSCTDRYVIRQEMPLNELTPSIQILTVRLLLT